MSFISIQKTTTYENCNKTFQFLLQEAIPTHNIIIECHILFEKYEL